MRANVCTENKAILLTGMELAEFYSIISANTQTLCMANQLNEVLLKQ